MELGCGHLKDVLICSQRPRGGCVGEVVVGLVEGAQGATRIEKRAENEIVV